MMLRRTAVFTAWDSVSGVTSAGQTPENVRMNPLQTDGGTGRSRFNKQKWS
jgi:hypothetical protein